MLNHLKVLLDSLNSESSKRNAVNGGSPLKAVKALPFMCNSLPKSRPKGNSGSIYVEQWKQVLILEKLYIKMKHI